MSDIVLFGAGSTAEVVTAYLEAHTEHRVIAYTVDQATMHGFPITASSGRGQGWAGAATSASAACSHPTPP